jgi:hypothetical protein
MPESFPSWSRGFEPRLPLHFQQRRGGGTEIREPPAAASHLTSMQIPYGVIVQGMADAVKNRCGKHDPNWELRFHRPQPGDLGPSQKFATKLVWRHYICTVFLVFEDARLGIGQQTISLVCLSGDLL